MEKMWDKDGQIDGEGDSRSRIINFAMTVIYLIYRTIYICDNHYLLTDLLLIVKSEKKELKSICRY